MKERQSNIELLRILSMLLVVLFHCNYFSLGDIKTFDSQSLTGITRIVCEQLCVVCVNVFVLISGWFGINPKIRSVASLIFQILFFSTAIITLCKLFCLPTPLFDCLKSLYFDSTNWFVPAYLILYSISPILNKYIAHSSSQELLMTIVSFFVVEFLFGFVYDIGCFNKGYSAWSFIGLYLLARYCRLYPSKFTTLSWRKDMMLYFVFTIIPSLYMIWAGNGNRLIYYNFPLVIVAALYLLLAFSKMKIQSRTINWVACSAFSVYLIHQHVLIRPLFREIMQLLWNSLPGYQYILCCLGISFALLIGGVLVDKIRIALWNCLIKQYDSHFCVLLNKGPFHTKK